MESDLVYLVDIDNTLLDNDAVVVDLKRYLHRAFGVEGERRYWAIFEELWQKLGYADYLGAFQRLRVERLRDPEAIRASQFLLTYPFADRVFPGALDAIAVLRRRAPVVILSDGDAVAQPAKAARSGLLDAVGGEILIYIHKEEMLDDVERRYPARRYVMVDDKIRILAAIKAIWRERVTTVFVRQGSYAMNRAEVDRYPPADVSIDDISEIAGVAL
ncbi:MAG: HAD family hydrolase [Acidobacteriota bacterium]